MQSNQIQSPAVSRQLVPRVFCRAFDCAVLCCARLQIESKKPHSQYKQEAIVHFWHKEFWFLARDLAAYPGARYAMSGTDTGYAATSSKCPPPLRPPTRPRRSHVIRLITREHRRRMLDTLSGLTRSCLRLFPLRMRCQMRGTERECGCGLWAVGSGLLSVVVWCVVCGVARSHGSEQQGAKAGTPPSETSGSERGNASQVRLRAALACSAGGGVDCGRAAASLRRARVRASQPGSDQRARGRRRARDQPDRGAR
eukprot:1650944-Rhodomonas_salina.1